MASSKAADFCPVVSQRESRTSMTASRSAAPREGRWNGSLSELVWPAGDLDPRPAALASISGSTLIDRLPGVGWESEPSWRESHWEDWSKLRPEACSNRPPFAESRGPPRRRDDALPSRARPASYRAARRPSQWRWHGLA